MSGAGNEGTAETVGRTLPLRLLQAVVVYWFALKLAALFVGEPHGDEAYYWVWGQHLALSYLDHPPLHAWLQGLMSLVFGWNLVALRILSLLTSAATLWVFWTWARRLAPENPKPTFWLTAALFYSTPILMLYTTVAIHDRLLVLLALGSMHFFALFFAEWTEGRRRYGLLYAAAALLGLATLSKYNGALVGVAVLVAILVRSDLRAMLKSPHLYLAALLSVAIQWPVVAWNLTENFASAHLHLSRGFEGVEVGTQHVIRILLESVLLLSPFAIVPLGRFVLTRAGAGFGGMLHSIGKWLFIVSTATILFVGFVREALFYWNILAYLGLLAAGVWAFRSRVTQALHIAWGVLLSTTLFVQFSVVPFLNSPDAKGLYGWSVIAEHVAAAEATEGADFAAAADWSQAARLAYATRDKDVASISPLIDGFDFWFDEADHAGKTAIVVMERGDGRLNYVRSRFESIEKIDEIAIDRFGIHAGTYELYVGRGYIADQQAP